jgi:hypothetical protein
MRARPLALAIAAGATSAVALALVRLGRSRTPGTRRDRAAAAGPQTHRCDCGQEFRVSGSGRHRVYWLAGAPDHDPVLSPQCPSCDRPLPHEADAAADQAPVTRGA